MSINIKETSEGKISLDIDNGDLRTIKNTIEKWKFKDIESYLKFAISVLARTENKNIWKN